MNNIYKTTTPAKSDKVVDVFAPLFSTIVGIGLIITIIVMIIAHYFATFRIRKELIKIREILEDSPLNKEE